MPPPTLIRLTWFDHTTQQRHETVKPLPVTIGRTANNTIQLDNQAVSTHHARLDWHNNQVRLTDLGSSNGISVNGKRITETTVAHAGIFRIALYDFTLYLVDAKIDNKDNGGTGNAGTFILPPNTNTDLAFDAGTDILIPDPQPTHSQLTTIFPPPAFQNSTKINLDRFKQVADYDETTYLAIGGGIGSFVWIDHLANFGVPRSAMSIIGFEPKPYGRYRRLCQNSQIPAHERLRSNSDSCPDNMWGFPSYATREMWGDFFGGRWGNMLRIGFKLFNEPYVETYTPISQHVFDSMDKEAERIGWEQMWQHGRVRMIRQTDDGRYIVAYSAIRPNQPSEKKYIVCKYLHLAVGYPGVRFLRDLQAYRQQTGDFQHVVNAYETHDHVYEDLKANGGVVLIRGRGIVASRIIQRIFEMRRDHNANVSILHLMRTPNPEGQRYQRAQRKVGNHWEFQPFNWPKAAWGGDLRAQLENATDEERSNLLDQWGGTTTADRTDWRDMVDQGIREGWYEIQFGDVENVKPHPDGIATVLDSNTAIQRRTELVTNYIVDATGLDADIKSNALLKDLVEHYDLPLNGKKRLFVTNDFEIEKLRNNDGRVYASGVITLGGPYAAVDSFLGLQYAALRSVDNLTQQPTNNLTRLNGFRSFSQWLKWARGVQP